MKLWKCILVSFSIVLLACAAKNYFVYFWHDVSFFGLLCPSIFGTHSLYVTPTFLVYFYEFQSWLERTAYSVFLDYFDDQLQVCYLLIIAPLVEEILYRGPLFLLRNCLNSKIWWGFAIVLSAIFAHSHGFYGIALLPLFVLGMCCSWLIKDFKSFWPAIMLHFLFNFYTLSFSLYQSLFWGD